AGRQFTTIVLLAVEIDLQRVFPSLKCGLVDRLAARVLRHAVTPRYILARPFHPDPTRLRMRSKTCLPAPGCRQASWLPFIYTYEWLFFQTDDKENLPRRHPRKQERTPGISTVL